MQFSVYFHFFVLFISFAFSVQATPTCSSTQIGGTVYRDYNSSGDLDTYESGVSGLTVSAYDSSNTLIESTQTDSLGDYTLNLGSTLEARIDLSTLPSFLNNGPHGSGSATSIVFVTNTTGCTVNFPVLNPADYCDSSPLLATTNFDSGDPLGNGTAGLADSIYSFDYSLNGRPILGIVDDPTSLAIASQTGAMWGLTHQRSSSSLFASAFLRRFSGFGTLGPGGIYKVDLTTDPATVTPFVDVSTIGINVGVDPRVTQGITLPANLASPAEDSLASELVGKMSLGDLDISEDQEYLWTVNLFDKTIYRIQIGSTPIVPVVADVTAFAIPASIANCSNNEFMPWGLGIQDGVIYAGVVCTAETSQSRSDLNAAILGLDPETSTFTRVIQFSINYPRGAINLTSALSNQWWPIPQDLFPRWNPHLPNGQYSAFVGPVSNVTRSGFPQPVISDLEIDEDGSFILGILDLASLQLGLNISFPSPHSAAIFRTSGFSGGDMLRVCRTALGEYELESNAACSGGEATNGEGNGHGPDGGEFYTDPRTGFEIEPILGGIAKLNGSNEVVANLFDPYVGNSAGTGTWNNVTGEIVRSYELAPGSGFGKTGRIGDLELLCDSAPLEIGNRVWFDTDADGIQEAGEDPVANITVSLKNGSNAVVISTSTTDSDGRYYFSVNPNSDYVVCLDNPTNFQSGASLYGYTLTTQNAGSSITIDSDAAFTSEYPCISFTSGSIGENNHTFDFGFVSGTPTENASQLVTVDSLSQYLAKLGRGAITKRVQGGMSGSCTPLAVSKAQQRKNRISDLAADIWINNWSIPSVTYQFSSVASIPPYCQELNLVSTKQVIKRDARKIKDLALASLLACKENYANALIDRITTLVSTIVDQVNELPASTSVCQ